MWCEVVKLRRARQRAWVWAKEKGLEPTHHQYFMCKLDALQSSVSRPAALAALSFSFFLSRKYYYLDIRILSEFSGKSKPPAGRLLLLLADDDKAAVVCVVDIYVYYVGDSRTFIISILS